MHSNLTCTQNTISNPDRLSKDYLPKLTIRYHCWEYHLYAYVRERLVGEGHINFLGRLIEEKARELELGKSWENERPRPEWHRLEFRAWLR